MTVPLDLPANPAADDRPAPPATAPRVAASVASLEQARRFTLERAAPAYLRAFAALARAPQPFPSTMTSLT